MDKVDSVPELMDNVSKYMEILRKNKKEMLQKGNSSKTVEWATQVPMHSSLLVGCGESCSQQ